LFGKQTIILTVLMMNVYSLNTKCNVLQIGPLHSNIVAFVVMAVKRFAKIHLSVIIPRKRKSFPLKARGGPEGG